MCLELNHTPQDKWLHHNDYKAIDKKVIHAYADTPHARIAN